jgi:hypothetical protein
MASMFWIGLLIIAGKEEEKVLAWLEDNLSRPGRSAVMNIYWRQMWFSFAITGWPHRC